MSETAVMPAAEHDPATVGWALLSAGMDEQFAAAQAEIAFLAQAVQHGFAAMPVLAPPAGGPAPRATIPDPLPPAGQEAARTTHTAHHHGDAHHRHSTRHFAVHHARPRSSETQHVTVPATRATAEPPALPVAPAVAASASAAPAAPTPSLRNLPTPPPPLPTVGIPPAFAPGRPPVPARLSPAFVPEPVTPPVAPVSTSAAMLPAPLAPLGPPPLPVAQPAATSPEAPREAPATRAHHAGMTEEMNFHGDVFLDGMRVGRWMSDRLARAAGGPATGSTSFDPRLGPRWPGSLQGG